MCIHLVITFYMGCDFSESLLVLHFSAGRINQAYNHNRHTAYKLLPNFIFLHLTPSQRKANKYIPQLFMWFLTKSQTIVQYKKNNDMMLLRRGDLPFICWWIYTNLSTHFVNEFHRCSHRATSITSRAKKKQSRYTTILFSAILTTSRKPLFIQLGFS